MPEEVLKMSWPPPPGTLGAILALIVLILVVVLAVIGRMTGLEAILIGMLALARLT